MPTRDPLPNGFCTRSQEYNGRSSPVSDVPCASDAASAAIDRPFIVPATLTAPSGLAMRRV
jgi:hypothetical protein